MRYLRITARPPAVLMPRAYRLLTQSDRVELADAVAVNVAADVGLTAMLHVAGDWAWLADELARTDEVVAVDATAAPTRGGYLLITVDIEEIPLLTGTFHQVATSRLVVVPPVSYDADGVHLRLVGDAAAVSGVVETLPDPIDVEVHEVGTSAVGPESPAAPLTTRQREALAAALDLGYYEHPRAATHDDVAAVLGCAPSTASEHLRKAEARLVRAAFPVAGGRR